MMSLAAGLGPHQEVYSIDVSFIDLSGVRGDGSCKSCRSVVGWSDDLTT
jgi:DNA polymerase V